MIQNRYVATVVAIAMIAPASLVTAWGNTQQSEPSTAPDATFQWPDAPGSAKDRIYFDAFLVNYVDGIGSANPGAAQSRASYVVQARAYAFFGYWRDCNHDGYVGSRLLGRDYYPSTTPGVDSAVCPTAGGTTLVNPVISFDQRFNDGVTIHEFVWIGRQNDLNTPLVSVGPVKVDAGGRGDARDVDDPEAKVWADYGLPTDVAFSDVLVHPFPRDTLRDGNSILGFVSYLQFCGNPDVPSSPLKACFSGDATGLRGQGDGVNVQHLPPDANDASSVTWTVKERYNDSDTREDWGTPIIDPRTDPSTCEQSDIASWPSTLNTEGSIAPTVNMLAEVGDPGTQCTPKNEIIDGNLETEDPYDTSAAKGGKRAPDIPLAFVVGRRYDLSQSDVSGPYSSLPHGAFPSASYQGSVIRFRNTPTEPDTLNFAAKSHLTAYAKLGSAAITAGGGSVAGKLATGATALGAFRYGSESCDFSTGAPRSPRPGYPTINANNWNCDRAVWEASRARTDAGIGVLYGILGDAYDLRDVDCFDGTLVSEAVLPTGQRVASPTGGTTTSDALAPTGLPNAGKCA